MRIFIYDKKKREKKTKIPTIGRVGKWKQPIWDGKCDCTEENKKYINF